MPEPHKQLTIARQQLIRAHESPGTPDARARHMSAAIAAVLDLLEEHLPQEPASKTKNKGG